MLLGAKFIKRPVQTMLNLNLLTSVSAWAVVVFATLLLVLMSHAIFTSQGNFHG
jgi:hypothetical protein